MKYIINSVYKKYFNILKLLVQFFINYNNDKILNVKKFQFKLSFKILFNNYSFVTDERGLNNCSSESDPIITLYSPTLVANIGVTVVLPCRASGKPTPQITWVNNYNVPLSLSTNLRHRVLDSGDLMIEELLWEDMGGYTCQAKSGNRQQVVSTFLYPLRVSFYTFI